MHHVGCSEFFALHIIHHTLRRPEQTMIEKEDEIFCPIIRQIFDETQGRIGAKKIRAIMMTQGYTISPERISWLMKETGLVCISTIKGTHYNFTPKGIYRHNRLKQDFHQEHPNKVWVSDITMLYVNYYSTVTRAHNIPLTVFANYFGLSMSYSLSPPLVVHMTMLWLKRSSEQSKQRKLPAINTRPKWN